MPVIEIDTFRLAAGVDDGEFLAADAAVQQGFAYQQPGLVRRTLARSGEGSWVVVTMWGDDDAARAAVEAAATDERVGALVSLVDASSRRVERYHTVD